MSETHDRPAPASSGRQHRSVVGYFGAKTRLASRIVQLLPAHRSYIEPFAGSMAVLMAKPRATGIEVANDIDQDVMTFWRVLRDQPDELGRVCALTPHSRAEYAASWPLPPGLPDLERARRVWVKLSQSRGGQLTNTGWRYRTRAQGAAIPSIMASYVERFGRAVERLCGVTLECRPALEVIDAYGREPGNLLYVDPPYLGQTRMRHAYQHEMQNEEEHRALVEALHRCQATVVLSGYPSALYDELYPGWATAEFVAYTGRGAASTGSNRRTEVLWCNRQFDHPQ